MIQQARSEWTSILKKVDGASKLLAVSVKFCSLCLYLSIELSVQVREQLRVNGHRQVPQVCKCGLRQSRNAGLGLCVSTVRSAFFSAAIPSTFCCVECPAFRAHCRVPTVRQCLTSTASAARTNFTEHAKNVSLQKLVYKTSAACGNLQQ